MKGKILLAALGGLLIAATAHASAYRIPEQSVNSTARAGAYVAHTPGADASYFNPANMAWLEDRGMVEVDLVWIDLPSISYDDNRTPAYDGESESEDFLLPTVFAVSPDYNNFRVGLSLTYPAGLSKEWKQPYPMTFAEEFTLKVVEFNPTVSYRVNDMLSLAAGFRVIYSDANVKSRGLISPPSVTASRYMDGDTWEMGYNLALSLRPTPESDLSVTYRSKVDLNLEGQADLATSAGPSAYSGSADVTVPLPAVLAVAGSYTFFDQLTVELEYDRTFWSEYDTLDFNYPVSLGNPYLIGAFDNPKAKDWEDTDTWRISVSYDMRNSFVLMAGFAIDDNPIPDATLGFDLPDADAKLYSVGLRYQATDKLNIGVAYLYDDKEKRTVTNSMVDGSFDHIGAHLFTVGVSYTF